MSQYSHRVDESELVDNIVLEKMETLAMETLQRQTTRKANRCGHPYPPENGVL